MPLPDFYEELMARTGYAVMLESKNTVEDRTRSGKRAGAAHLHQRLSGECGEEPSLAGFLDEIALYTDLDSHDPDQDCVVMMTMHSAKGLEFPVVFVVGAEEGIFPGIRAIGETEEMEEERRLCYVAMTRAKEKLYLTCANQRMLFGRTSSNRPSRFVDEIPTEHLERSGRTFLDPGVGTGGHPQPHLRVRGIPAGGEQSYGGYAAGGARRPAARSAFLRRFHPGHGGRTGGVYPAAPAAAVPSAPGLPPGCRRSTSGAAHLPEGGHGAPQGIRTGMILSVQKMGGDALVEIAFDNVGTKRLMLKSAAAHMEKI